MQFQTWTVKACFSKAESVSTAFVQSVCLLKLAVKFLYSLYKGHICAKKTFLHMAHSMLHKYVLLCHILLAHFAPPPFWTQKLSEPKVKQPKPPPQVKEENPAPVEEGPSEQVDGGGGASESELGETLCGMCGESYGPDEFWICCDICEKWFHGKCVKITAAKAEHIKQYKCPSCTGGGGNSSSKRARQS